MSAAQLHARQAAVPYSADVGKVTGFAFEGLCHEARVFTWLSA